MTESSQRKSKTQISLEIENYRLINDCSYLESIVDWAEENEIDIEDMNEYVSEVLISKLRVEQIRANTIKDENPTSTGSLGEWL
ncbi:MAG: hypothetical protein [Caudoviricetes sp.]|nr:MAG: hypothetical protein [Caudoviricetes sp.]